MDIDCGSAQDLKPGEIQRVEVPDGEPIAIYNVDGEFYATEDNCSHKWASLATGWLEGYAVVCPWHGGAHDVRTGKAIGPPCVKAVRSFPVCEKNSRLIVTLER